MRGALAYGTQALAVDLTERVDVDDDEAVEVDVRVAEPVRVRDDDDVDEAVAVAEALHISDDTQIHSCRPVPG